MSTPRIAESDILLPEDLLEGSLFGEWVRVSAYRDGHRVSANPSVAWCGTPLVYTEEWWDQVQAWAYSFSGYENRAKGEGKWSPTPYYLARDRRKGRKCSICKGKVDYGAMDIEEPEVGSRPTLSAEMTAPFEDPTLADLLTRQRLLTKASWVARELGATLVDSTNTEAA